MTRPTLLSHRLRDETGATLVEVLVALALASAAIFALAQGLSGRVARDAVSEGIAVLKDAITEGRFMAQSSQEPVRLVFNDDRLLLLGPTGAAIPSRRVLQLPASLTMRIISAREVQYGGRPGILLLPDGRSSGGEIELAEGRQRGKVAIDDQTSRLTILR
jgi:Flp pilus assembly pilin Flp